VDVPNGSVSSVYLAVESVALHCDHWCTIGEGAAAPLAFTLTLHYASLISIITGTSGIPSWYAA